jgi:antirestriction protein ArdC
MEELVAEMGAAYLSGICGIQNRTIDLSASYIQGWLKKFKSDNKFVIQAASYAQRAVDYILEHQRKPAESVVLTEEGTIPVSFSF